jgi:hypothetical protein
MTSLEGGHMHTFSVGQIVGVQCRDSLYVRVGRVSAANGDLIAVRMLCTPLVVVADQATLRLVLGGDGYLVGGDVRLLANDVYNPPTLSDWLDDRASRLA